MSDVLVACVHCGGESNTGKAEHDNLYDCASSLVRQVDTLRAELALVTQQRDNEVRLREELSSELWDREQEVLSLRADLTQAKLLRGRPGSDAARRDADTLAESIFDFIGSRGTPYEADQYHMLCGLVRGYFGSTTDAKNVTPSATATDLLFPGAE